MYRMCKCRGRVVKLYARTFRSHECTAPTRASPALSLARRGVGTRRCLACTNDKGVDMLDADVQNLMNRLNDWRNEANGIMHELLVAPVIAKDGSSAFLKVSAREDTLQYYAEQMKLPMRLKGDTEVKRAHAKFGGMVPFVQENVHMFAFERHKSWTEEGSVFCSGERQKIVQYIIRAILKPQIVITLNWK